MSERICVNCRSFFEGVLEDDICKNCANKSKNISIQRNESIIKEKENTCKRCGSKFLGRGSLCSACYNESFDEGTNEGIDSYEKYWKGMF